MEINLLAPEVRDHVREHFDDESGYAKNLEVSRAHFRRRDACRPCELVDSGIEKLSVLSEADAREMCRKMDGHLLEWADTDEILALLDGVLTPEIDSRLVSYFESEYLPTTVGFRASRPVTTAFRPVGIATTDRRST